MVVAESGSAILSRLPKVSVVVIERRPSVGIESPLGLVLGTFGTRVDHNESGLVSVSAVKVNTTTGRSNTLTHACSAFYLGH